MKGLLIISVLIVLCLHGDAATQTRTENGYTLTYENVDTSVPQTTFQKYIDLFFDVYPKMCAKYNTNCAKQMALVTDASYDGAAFNSASKITVGGTYAREHPDDINMIAHEAFHSVQAYPNGEPLWITEGLANYAGNEYTGGVSKLGKYRVTDNYTLGYDDAARFFVYLENRFPGIVKYIDSTMRNNQQASGQFWMNFTGKSVEQLWNDYKAANAVVCSNGNGVTTWNTATRDFALELFNGKRSQIANGTFVMSNGALAPAAKNMNKLTYSCGYEEVAQQILNSCNGVIPPDTFGLTLQFPWLVNSINEALTNGVPALFGFTVANQNGNAMLTAGSGYYAYDNAKTIGCAHTTTPCDPNMKTTLLCLIGPALPASSPVYSIGSKCTANSQCTKTEYTTCDIPSGLCVSPVTTTTTTTTTTKTPTTTTTTTGLSGWTEWAAGSCTANCGLCGRTVMIRTCRGGSCPGANTMTTTTPCGGNTLCPFGLGYSSCCSPAVRGIVNSAFVCKI